MTSAKRMRSKLVAVKEQLRRRMHQTIAEQERYLSAMVIRHVR
ncbi:reverse transcriptase (plasmid) [Cupriavidus necator H16]|uniref:Reverse transcriptase n=1 Tax=Cupriavidus necator (strain ATCC 17699 / DSM 428 / KCTC 22496 / NCIMB 10442 / H16 / Stanier 337) TaxID=381666 RepID=Q7WWV1_CUPNH|nr:reverse transcriptase [Cupriavidus necator H16]